jgi:Tfp pilus assembly protein PilO
MSDIASSTYKNEYNRYRQYYHRLWVFYQKPAAKVSIALLLTIFTIIFFAVFAIRPTLLTVAELVKKIQDKKETLAQIEQKAAQLASAQQEYITAQSNLPLLATALPDKPNAQQLMQLIEATAAYHQISLQNVSIGTVSYSQKAIPYSPGIQKIPISLSVSADYSSLNAFLYDLSRLNRQYSINTVSFILDESTSVLSSSPTLTLNLSGEVYFVPSEPSVTP